MAWLKEIIIPFDEFEKGAYHSVEEENNCATLTETDGGCPVCMEELEAVEEIAIAKAERDQYDFVDIMLTNIPAHDQRYWEFDVKLKHP